MNHIQQRKIIKDMLKPFEAKRDFFAIAWLFIGNWCLFILSQLLIFTDSVILWVIGMFSSAIFIARLFITGHDASHGSLVSNKKLNKLIAQLVFLPSLTPQSLWDAGHNVAHHGYTNLKGVDYVWTPFSVEEFQKLPKHRQWLERIYRSGFGFWLYYMIEMWWKQMAFPRFSQQTLKRPEFTRDRKVVFMFFILWMGLYAAACYWTGHHFLRVWFMGFAIPFSIWCGIIGLGVFIHHAHPDVQWYTNKSEWAANGGNITHTVVVGMPIMSRLLHNIMEHQAHHISMQIPLYNLRKAQDFLFEHIGGRYWRFTWAEFFRVSRTCQLYDYSNHQWLPFAAADQTDLTVNQTRQT